MCQYTQYVIRLIIQHVCNMIQYRIHMIMIQYTREMLQCRLVTVTRWQYMVTQSAITFTRLVHNTHFPHSTCQSTQYFSIDTWHVILPSLPHTVCRYSRYWHTICINTHCHTVCVDRHMSIESHDTRHVIMPSLSHSVCRYSRYWYVFIHTATQYVSIDTCHMW